MDLIIFDTIKAAILGIMEGFTEFLPISSTGHLILLNEFISFSEEFNNFFNIFIQLGAILAVLIFFWDKLWPFSKDKAKNKETMNVWYKTIIGVLPVLICGYFLAGAAEKYLFNSWTVAIALLIGGLIILFIENKGYKPKINSVSDLSFKTAFLIGLVQCLSMIPGTSRSAVTIIGALLLGCSRVVSTEFSFFLSIPTLGAASVYSLLKYWDLLDLNQLPILIVGFVTAFIVALIVIKFLINYIQRNNFKVFGYYRIILGIIIIAYFLIKDNLIKLY